jgi:hypothetical protein
MKAHNISPKGALSGSATPAGGANGPASSPTTAPKKRATKKRKVQAESEEDDEIPNIKQEVKKEVKAEKKPKVEPKDSDDGSFLLSDIPEAPPGPVKKEESCGDGSGVGAHGDVDVCHACTAEQAVKYEPGLKYEHEPSPHHHPSLDHGGAFTHTMTPTAATQSFGYGTNSSFQSLAPAQMPLLMRRTEESNGPAGVFPRGSWLQTGPQHYYWDENNQL